MAKYIDAEKLRAEIEKRMEKHWDNLPDSDSPEDDWTHNELCVLGAFKELEHIEYFLNSLQQDKETLELCSKIWWEEQGWIMIPPNATIKGIDSLLKQVRKKLQQEQPEVDLEKEYTEFVVADPVYSKLVNGIVGKAIARHFYGLGLKAKEENK